MKQDEAFRQALVHYRAGRGGQARRICRDIVAANGDHGKDHAMLGLLAHREHDLHEAARRYLRASELEPDEISHRANLGIALVAARRWTEALDAMRQATIAFPHSPILWCNLGNACAGQRSWSAAQKAFARALEAEPDNAEHHYNLALAHDKAGGAATAEHHYKATLLRMPEHAEARNNLGLLLFKGGRHPEATEQFSLVLRLQDHLGAGINLARLLAESGRSDEGLALATQVAERNPAVADAPH